MDSKHVGEIRVEEKMGKRNLGQKKLSQPKTPQSTNQLTKQTKTRAVLDKDYLQVV